MDPRIAKHVVEINRCNQRGGRMLTILDLLEAGTLNREMASYLLAAVSRGSNFLVGARPGGAGKTAVMAALLNFIPDLEIVPADGSRTIAKGLLDDERRCYLAHEIGHGRWYAYVWGDDLANFLRLAGRHMIVSNIHAAEPGEILDAPGLDEESIQAFDLLIFLRVRRHLASVRRRISAVYEKREGRGLRAFKLIHAWDDSRNVFRPSAPSTLVGQAEIVEADRAIREIVERGLRDIADVRAYILKEFLPCKGSNR
jgi:hypothetical protein